LVKKKSYNGVSPRTEADWRNEDNVRTLARAKEIMTDPKLVKGAAEAAKRVVDEKTTELAALKSVIKKGKK
jgi:hypothetical protein